MRLTQTPVRPGAQLPWEESFCRAMTEGRAPRVATVTAAVPEYAALTKGLGRNVAAYLGVPLVAPDGSCSAPSAAWPSGPSR